jgi:hypothetical protein
MKMPRALPVVLFMVLMTTLGLSSSAWAQVDRGAIKGEIQDTEHANIPDAQITLKNEATGVVANTTSGASGQFNFLNLSAGVYTLTSTAKGFSTSVQQHITVGVGSTFGLTVTMQTGQVEQTVTVSGTAGTVETQTSDIGTVITPQEIRDLPVSLNGDMRNPLNFVTLTPGVSSSTPGPSPDYRLHISGSNSYSNEVYIDGVPVMNTDIGGILRTIILQSTQSASSRSLTITRTRNMVFPAASSRLHSIQALTPITEACSTISRTMRSMPPDL